LHVPAGMQTDSGRSAYEKEVLFAEKLARRLGWAVETYREHVDGGWKGRLSAAGREKGNLRNKLHGKATHHYWTAVEKLRALLMAHVEVIGGEPDQVEASRSEWRKALHGAARESYRTACGQDTPRQMRAFALGWARLFAPLAVEEAAAELDDETLEE